MGAVRDAGLELGQGVGVCLGFVVCVGDGDGVGVRIGVALERGVGDAIGTDDWVGAAVGGGAVGALVGVGTGSGVALGCAIGVGVCSGGVAGGSVCSPPGVTVGAALPAAETSGVGDAPGYVEEPGPGVSSEPGTVP